MYVFVFHKSIIDNYRDLLQILIINMNIPNITQFPSSMNIFFPSAHEILSCIFYKQIILVKYGLDSFLE